MRDRFARKTVFVLVLALIANMTGTPVFAEETAVPEAVTKVEPESLVAEESIVSEEPLVTEELPEEGLSIAEELPESAAVSEAGAVPEDAAFLPAEEDPAPEELNATGSGPVEYVDYTVDDQGQLTKQIKSCTEYTIVSSDTTSFNGFFVAEGEVSVNNLITVTGSVNLILRHGCSLTAEKGINVTKGNSFYIYEESGEGVTGVLFAGKKDKIGIWQAGIGTGIDESGGVICINGGVINVQGGYGGAGIGAGSGSHYSDLVICINGGKIDAQGGYGGAGIGAGSGSHYSDLVICINGGKIDAQGSGGGAGIGGARNCDGGEIHINGGEINAKGSADGKYNYGGAGIGAGFSGSGGVISINEGKIDAQGSGGGAGIGGGHGLEDGSDNGDGGKIHITGGVINAKGDSGGAGIGGGKIGRGEECYITGGVINAQGDEGGAGIGGGYTMYSFGGSGGKIRISGGVITASGNSGGAGIGDGYNNSGKQSNISLGWTNAWDQIYATSYSAAVDIIPGKAFYIHPVRSDLISGNAVGPDRIDDKTLFPAGSYSISINKGIVNGKVTADQKAIAGDTVVLTVSPDSGYELATGGLSVKDASGNSIPVSGSLAFVMPASDVTIDAVFKKAGEPQPPDPKPTPPEPEAKKGLWVKGINKDGYAYTGGIIKPVLQVYFDGTLLTEKQDYTLKYSRNKYPGTGKILITGKGNFRDKKEESFNIIKTELSLASSGPEPVVEAYKKGKKHNKVKPVLYLSGNKLKLTSKDVSYSYLDDKGKESACIEEGSYTIRITASEKSLGYKGFVDIPMTVTSRSLMKNAKVKLTPKSVKYTGEKALPEISVTLSGQTLTVNKDYTVSCADDCIEPGIHKLILSGNGTEYIGKKVISFKITGKHDLSDGKYAKATVSAAECVFMTGGAKPSITVTYKGEVLKAGRDYKVSFADNKKAGTTASFTVRGKGSYTGKLTGSFAVKKCDIGKLFITAADRKESNKTDDYKKTAITFTDGRYKKQKLKADQDYKAVFTVSGNAPKAGNLVTVKLSGTGDNYTGSATVTFRIKSADKDLSKAAVTVHSGKAYDYTGRAVCPSANEIVVKLGRTTVSSDSFEITGFYNNVDKGTATLTLKGRGEYYGDKKVSFKIGAVKLTDIWGGIFSKLLNS